MILFHVMMASLTLFAADLDLDSSIYVDDDAVVTAFAVQDNGADGDTESDAIEVYIPFKSGTAGGGSDDLDASYYSELPYIDSVDIFKNENSDGTTNGKKPCLIFTVSSNQTDSTFTKFHFMVDSGNGTYYRIPITTGGCEDAYDTSTSDSDADGNYQQDTVTISNGSSATIYVSWQELAYIQGVTDYDDWNDDDSTISLSAYIYLGKVAKTSVSESDREDDDYDNGLYFTFNFKTGEPTTPATLTNLAKGDTQLTLSYDATDSFEDDLDQLIFISAYAPVTAGTSWKSFKTSPGGDELPNTSDADESGEFKLTGLTNNKLYYITLSARDVYYFMSPLPATLENTPQELKAFIQEKSCYLLSAGFQTDHPVLEFFRRWRDQTLSHLYLGKKFIHWYYATAPQYTQIIIDHPMLAAFVRTFGYLAYGLVRFFWWWVGLLIAVVAVMVILPLTRFRKGSYR